MRLALVGENNGQENHHQQARDDDSQHYNGSGLERFDGDGHDPTIDHGSDCLWEDSAMLHRFRSKRSVVCVKVAGEHRKLMQVMFSRRDGSVFLSFPYYEHSTGLVSMAKLEPGATEVDLAGPGGRVTSHLVKYSHHPDGRAHFSQDGKVHTKVIRQAAPLDGLNGHLFTCQLQGLESFAILEDRYRYMPSTTPNRAVLTFDFEDEEPEAIKIVGHLYSEASLQIVVPPGVDPGPLVTTVDPDGTERRAFLLSPPADRPGADRVLAMSAEAIPRLTDDETALTFIGGFPPRGTIAPTAAIEFLALSYPSDSEAPPQLPSVDLLSRE